MRGPLIALLLASAALFAVGVSVERSQTGEPAAVEAHESGTEQETLHGVNTESTPLIVVAVIAGLGLAVLVAAPTGRRRRVLLAVGAIALAWAALDVREVVHQVGESRTGLALLAAVVALLHLAAAGVAARSRATMPA